MGLYMCFARGTDANYVTKGTRGFLTFCSWQVVSRYAGVPMSSGRILSHLMFFIKCICIYLKTVKMYLPTYKGKNVSII